jgi:hypothetical protein
VQRHHNGQSGRPGCWEKSGKPDGEDGQWDRDASCEIKLSDLEYVKVQEGWVVTSWGSVNVEGVREGEDEDDKVGGTVEALIAETGKGKKRKAVAKSKPVVEVDARVESEDSSEDAEGSDESPEPEAPKAKRQKVVKTEKGGSDAAVRAAALGLRTRK